MSYVTNIANSIKTHSGDSALLGPEIYTAIAEWEKSEIPAAVVLSSIDEVCGRVDAIGEASVELFQDVVTRNFTAWLSDGSDYRRMSA